MKVVSSLRMVREKRKPPASGKGKNLTGKNEKTNRNQGKVNET
jgi:hypothetical protein